MHLMLQRGVGDCAIAALATFLDFAYEDVYSVFVALDATYRGKLGNSSPRIIKAAAMLDVTLRRRKKPDLDEHEGLLVVEWVAVGEEHHGSQHMVVLTHGVIIDPSDGEILDADEYLARNSAIARELLEIKR